MRDYAAIPNSLLLDPDLRPSTRRVAFALWAYRGRKNAVCRTVRALAGMCHMCQATVRQALCELEESGYLRREHRWRYDARLGRSVYRANRYVLRVDMARGYTLIPRSILRAEITHTQFSVYLLLMVRQGRGSHSYPSLRRIAATLWIAKSTVCIAIAVLSSGQYVAKNHCRSRLGCYSCNCYYVIVVRCSLTAPLGTAYHVSPVFARA